MQCTLTSLAPCRKQCHPNVNNHNERWLVDYNGQLNLNACTSRWPRIYIGHQVALLNGLGERTANLVGQCVAVRCILRRFTLQWTNDFKWLLSDSCLLSKRGHIARLRGTVTTACSEV
uniref:Uncharacterized protein n=1 Tax=Trichuris muris TaxID=70415 RepID=A0A5S6QRR0_TRIMR